MAKFFNGATIGGKSYSLGNFCAATPSHVIAAIGSTAVFSVSDSIIGDTGHFSYQWEYSSSTASGWANANYTGNKTATLKVSVTAARNGTCFRCKITVGGETITTNACLLNAVEENAQAELPADPT